MSKRVNKKQIARIAKYEKMMDEAEQLLASEQAGERLSLLIAGLEDYYRSPEWKRDFADDEAGLLPECLKRGVLSEDGIYNVLERFEELNNNTASEEMTDCGSDHHSC